MQDSAEARLEALAEQVRKETAYFSFYRKPWVKPREHSTGAPVHNVFIVGAGHCGASIYVGLQQSGIDRLAIIDAAESGQEGVWAQYDRMHTLRTPKDFTGPDWGLPSLTFRAYCEARFGPDYWTSLGRTVRKDYADYMAWYRTTLQIPVQSKTRLALLQPEGDLFRLECERAGTPVVFYARNVILATGYATDGEPFVPPYLRKLDASRCAHSSAPISFSALAGKRVGILGHGAGAFDCAGMALEAGAKTVDLCFRRREIPKVNPYRWFEFPGFMGHYADLPDETKWRFSHALLRRDQPPAQHGYDRAKAFPNFTMRPETNWLAARDTPEGVEVETTQGRFTFDFLIAATGLTGDFKFRSELNPILDHIATWADRYQPPPGLESANLAAQSYVGPHFELLEKHPGTAPYLKNIFLFSSGAAVSHGPSITSLSGLRYGLVRVLHGVRSQLFTQDIDAYFADYEKYAHPELIP